MTSPDYELLKAYGHSPAKATEIVLDAGRGDFWCKQWIKFVKRNSGVNRVEAFGAVGEVE